METKTILENGVLKTVPFDYKPARLPAKKLSKEEARELAFNNICIALQSIDPSVEPELASRIAHQALDRIDGKPGQAVTVTSNVNINLVALEQMQLATDAINETIARLSPPTIDN